MGDVLRIEHSWAGYRALLLGNEAWHGTPGDTAEHRVELTVRGISYTLRIDEQEFTAVSYLRPRSLVIGNPTVLASDYGTWTEVGISQVVLATRDPLVLPLIRQGIH